MNRIKIFLKRAGAVVLTAALAAAILGGCSGKKAQGNETKELTLFSVTYYTPYSPDLPIWKEAEKRTGIRLTNTVADSVTNEEAAFGTMLISKMRPDIVLSGNASLRSMALKGGLVALDEYMDEYAPNLKAFFEACPLARATATAEDGHIYFVPGTTTDLNRPNTPSTGFFIRTDWLNKLHLKTPETIEELHDVLLAFKTQDPNGNGKADEVPYFCRDKNLSGLLNLFCTATGYIEKNGSVVYGPAQENYRLAIKTLSAWYKEGLIDSEIYTRVSAREQLLSRNLGGCTSDWFSSTAKFNESYSGVTEDFRLAPMLPPKNVEGRVTWPETRGVLHGRGWGISTDCDAEKIIDAVKYLDFWMSSEGCELMAYGVEGVSYTRDENGGIIWSQTASEYPDGIPNYRRYIGFIETGTVGSIEAEKAGMNPIALEGYEMYEKIVSNRLISGLPYNEEEQRTDDKLGESIRNYMNEMQKRWILGIGDVESEWDAYIDNLNRMGLGELNAINEAAYARIKDYLN